MKFVGVLQTLLLISGGNCSEFYSWHECSWAKKMSAQISIYHHHVFSIPLSLMTSFTAVIKIGLGSPNHKWTMLNGKMNVYLKWVIFIYVEKMW